MFAEKLKYAVSKAVRSAARTTWWMFRITAAVSFAMFLLKYTGILTWVATAVSPLFNLFGLPGSAALAYVSGYFINVYSCIAVVSTINLTARELTILGTMTLAAHSMILESAVQHKTGTSRGYVYAVRTVSSLALGLLLNLLLPGRPDYSAVAATPLSEVPLFMIQGNFGALFVEWLTGLARLSVIMTLLIFALNILQRSLYEFGIMEKIAKVMSPLLKMFGLDPSTSFLWIVANLAGLSYGAAAMLDELQRGSISRWNINLLNTHIGISHSNLEDLTLMSALGGTWYILLLSRWAMAALLVWTVRLVRPRFLLT